MLKKIRLDRTKIYEKYLALEEISIMLESFANGRPHHLSIGAEQGDIEGWDDFVIEKNNGGYIYIQAKRQTTDFSKDAVVRDNISQGKNKGTPRQLSPFDKAMETLAKKIKTVDKQSEFWIALPEGDTEIKQELQVRNFITLCEDYIKDITIPQNLIESAKTDKNLMKIYNWLTTWCGFADWDHIFKALKVLRIIETGREQDILKRTKENLSRIFINSEVENVYKLIFQYLDENSTHVGAIMPRQLIHTLQKYLISNMPRWTQFQIDEMQCNISGIHDLEKNIEVERPEIIVPALWNRDNENVRNLHIFGSCLKNCKISEGLMRLLLHPVGSVNICCSNKSSWLNSVKSKIGETLGITKSDFDYLSILDGPEPYQASECISLTTINAKENFAESLQNEMYKTTFELLNSEVVQSINAMNSGDLRTEVESKWANWRHLLQNDIGEQKRLFSKILHPKAEGESISGELRVGLKTVPLLSEAIFHLLIVSVCLGDTDNQQWYSVENGIKVNTIGLAFWSGPATKERNVIKIDDYIGGKDLLINETEQIIIIPQSSLPVSEFYQDDIAGEKDKVGLLTYPKYPELLITKDNAYMRKVRNGTVSELREYFGSRLKQYNSIIENSINHVIGEIKNEI